MVKQYYQTNNILHYELRRKGDDRNAEPIITSPTEDGLLDWVCSQQLDFTVLYMDIIAFKYKNSVKVPFLVNKHPIWLKRFFELIKK